MTRPTRIISGGQTGADQGALAAARDLDILTGGWMPRGYLTEAGSRPNMAIVYGVQEHRVAAYPPRTYANVKEADGTIWIGPTAAGDSTGLRCTLRAVRQYGRPFLHNPDPRTLLAWVAEHRVGILNVAGPRASRDPLAYARAYDLIVTTFGGLRTA